MQDPRGAGTYGVIESLIFHRLPPDHSDQWFRAAGVVHLYSASGIHLLALLGLLEGGLKIAGARTRVRAETLEVWVWVCFAVISILIWRAEGFHFSLFRPLVSILLRRWLRLSGRSAGVFLPLAIVLVLEGVFAHFRGWSPGAWHYYLAVGGSLVALARRDSGQESGFRMHLRMALYSWVPLAVWDLVHDRFSAPFTPVLSLITIPAVAFLLYPMSLLSIAWRGDIHPWVEGAWNGFFAVLIPILEAVPPGWRVSGMALGAGWFFSVLFFRYRKDPRILVIFPLAWVLRLTLPLEAPHRVIQLDVGQGDSALIQKAGRNELIDVGSGRVQGPDRWVRILSRYGVHAPLGVLLSHLDEDHVGGLRALLASGSVGCIEIGPPHLKSEKGRQLLKILAVEFPETRILERGCIRLSKVGWFGSRRSGAAGNRWMAGVVHPLGPTRGYFALGDGDGEQELGFLSHFSRDIRRLDQRIWKVGHHGSRFSTDPEFIKILRPREFWISVGKKNRYGHPAAAVMNRLWHAGGQIHRTDQEGDLVLTE